MAHGNGALRPPLGRRRHRRRGGAALVGLALGLGAGSAAGNGAFPESQAVLTPPERPLLILLATNFGLVSSDDGGRRWTWSCEQDPTGTRNLYQLGPPPARRLFARDPDGLVWSDDAGCRWTKATGDLGGAVVVDAFPDPSDGQRVLAVAAPRGGAGGGYRVLESSDGGGSFGETRYAAGPDDAVTGVEIARADPTVAYLTIVGMGVDGDLTPRLARTTDRGASWQEQDLGTALGAGSVALVAVDTRDPGRVFLQMSRGTSSALAVVDGGGATAATPLVLEGGFMTAFLETEAGTIFVAGLVGADAALYRSRDGARSFDPLPSPPRLWGLSERAGVLFGAARTGEPFAIGTSADEGATWQPLMRYADVQAVTACAQIQCQDDCLLQASRGLWPPAICAPPPAPDAAVTEAGTIERPSGDSGCGCALARSPSAGRAALLAALLLPLLRRRR